MKKLLVASAAVAALFAAAPAFAGSGQVDLSYTNVEDEVDVWSLGGAAVTEVGADWNIQGDATVHRVDVGGGNINFTDAALHLFKRNDSYAMGVYVDSSDIEMASAWGLGVEGQKFFDKATIAGSIGWNTAESFGSDMDGWNATLGATFFATDNFSIGAGVGYADFDFIDSVTTWDISAEFKPESSPVSFFAGYSNQDVSSFGGDDVSAWTLGARWNFGGGSLKERDRSGASMKGGLSLGDLIF
ncbi:hypothetical protein [Caulobacter sp. 17J80-11]|uniref:hypothetical protein n=1 Tax=Caulobacter sp. 17J80-11 TaxID=2763502 RepID=UPI001653AC18|nr:hypothetical protein [Caulobacter sp. 17J80-11]MBC6981433.1 hypothetical protein [Caulobacter sp. 17J80-11]